MTWGRPILLAVLALLLAFALYSAESASVRDVSTARSTDRQGAMRRIFMRDTDASSFFNQRSQRWAPSQHEIAEQRQRATAVGRRRDYIEEQRNRLENIAEEQRDVQGERSHERVEQWKEFNYDGLFPSSMFSRFYI